MLSWQISFLLLFAAFNLYLFSRGLWEVYKKHNAYGETPFLYPLSMYVWGDALIFGLFWMLAALTSLVIKDFILFLLIASLFWMVRSVGETIYWFNQQFSPITRMDPKKYWTNKIFHNDSVWFIFQIANQCLTVITIITSLYLAKIWLSKVPY